MTIYLKSSDIPGAVSATGYTNVFELLSVEFGYDRLVQNRTGNPSADAGTVKVTEVTCTKYWDTASTKLMAQLFDTKALATLDILFVRQDAAQPLTYVDITLEQVFVTSWHQDTTSGEQPGALVGTVVNDRPVETFKLNFGKITVKNTPIKPDGTAGSPASAGWDVLKSVKV